MEMCGCDCGCVGAAVGVWVAYGQYLPVQGGLGFLDHALAILYLLLILQHLVGLVHSCRGEGVSYPDLP